jgi:DNA-directed RNA polymerase alpha subunit
MASFILKSKKPFDLKSEFLHFPISFVNGLRRTCLSEIPCVVLRDIEILKNTTQMPHEMLKHRLELLPIDLDPDNSDVIKNAKIELLCNPIPDKDRYLTTDDFTIENGPKGLLMKDRDLKTPLLFLKVKKTEEVHVRAKLSVETISQVCGFTYKFHIDEEREKVDKERYIEDGGDERVFKNFYNQKSYSVDETKRPNHIDFGIESVGVLSSQTILKMAVSIMENQISDWVKEGLDNIKRSNNEYSVSLKGGHTIGSILQEIIYHSQSTGFVSYDLGHPLKPILTLRFVSESKPEDILKDALKTLKEYCAIVEKQL